ncbi:N,N'-diacetyllegionaminic acid synthase [compost metagenome]
MVADIRKLEQAFGDGSKAPQASEWDTRKAARQQVVAARPIAAGTPMTRSDLTTARTGKGLAPSMLWELVSKPASKGYQTGEIINL